MLLKITDGTVLILNGVRYHVTGTSMTKCTTNDKRSHHKVYMDVSIELATGSGPQHNILMELTPGHIVINEDDLDSLVTLMLN